VVTSQDDDGQLSQAAWCKQDEAQLPPELKAILAKMRGSAPKTTGWFTMPLGDVKGD
jgi:hypothetical protein